MLAAIKAWASRGCSRYASACRSGLPDLSRKGRSGNVRPNPWPSSLVQWSPEFAKASRWSNLELLNLVPASWQAITLHNYFPATTRQFWLDGSNSKVQTWSIRIRLLYARASKPSPHSTRPHDNTTCLHLKELMDRLDMYQLCDEATHLNCAGEPASLLDLGFTNVPHLFKSQATVSPPVSTSDHLPVIFHTCLQHQPYTPTNHHHLRWLFSHKDKEQMMNSFSFDNWSWVFNDENDINTVWKRWKSQFFREVQSFIPRVQPQSQNKMSQPPWFNKSIRQLLRKKDRLFKRACSSKLPEHWTIYRAVRNKANNTIKTAKAKQFNHMASRLADPKCPPSKWWSLARNLCGLKGHSSNFIPPLSGRDHGPVLSDNLEKANAFNDVFINQNTSTALENFPFGPTTTESLFSVQTVTASEVKSVLKSLPSKISTGVDNISYRLLKEAGPGVVGPLTTLFNISLRKRQVPEEWKRAVVLPVFKGGNRDRQEVLNYRPISLTPCVTRVLEKILNTQLLKYLQDNSLICQQQAGFLPLQSTTTQLCSLIHQWQMALDRGDNVEAVFLDLSKAYDRVSVPGLISKMSQAGFSQSMLQWFSSFLERRQQQVLVNGSYSSWELNSQIRNPSGNRTRPDPLSHFCKRFADVLVNRLCSLRWRHDNVCHRQGYPTDLYKSLVSHVCCVQLGTKLGYAFQRRKKWTPINLKQWPSGLKRNNNGKHKNT